MRAKKLILFDWGNIVESHLTGYNCRDAWDILFKKCGYTGDKRIFGSLREYKLSALKNEEEYKKAYEGIKKEFNLKVDFETYKKYYYESFDKIEYYKEVRDYEISLKERCYVGILSNLSIFDEKRIDRQLNLKEYDYVFLSFKIGYRKPSIELFEYVSSSVPFKKEDILFIDDTIYNVNAAKEFGWKTLHASGLELDKIKKACEEFLN